WKCRLGPEHLVCCYTEFSFVPGRPFTAFNWNAYVRHEQRFGLWIGVLARYRKWHYSNQFADRRSAFTYFTRQLSIRCISESDVGFACRYRCRFRVEPPLRLLYRVR